MITTNNKERYDWLMKFRNYGSDKKYYHEFLGRNARMDTVQAAVLNVKLPYLEGWIKKRNEAANQYLEGLANVGDIVLPTVEANNFSAYHLFMIRTQKRNDLFNYLKKQGVQTIIHFPIPIHLQTAYAVLGLKEGSFPVVERLANEILSIPMHPNLEDEEIAYVIDMVKQFFT